ncbi:MAG: carboxypeptidase regulatory-like domain-containing protein [Gemmatimonadota bacterium]
MKAKRPFHPAFLAAALAAAGAPALAGQTSGAVTGTVFDSLAMEPLGGAAVFLWGTTLQTETDSTGHFQIGDVPVGDYQAIFFHPKLGRLGISPGPVSVQVRAGTPTDIALAIPSRLTVTASHCLFEDRPDNTATLAGRVGDGDSGVGIPGARVTLSWTPPEGGDPKRMQLRTFGDGWFRTCRAPAQVPITVSAAFLDRQGLRREVALKPGGAAQLDFVLARLQPIHLVGHLVDAESGQDVTDAEVWLRGTSFRGVTGENGRFTFSDVPPGRYMLVADHLRYGRKMDTLDVSSGQNLHVEMRLDTRPIPIAPITVTVDARPLTERSMGGLTITRAEIEKVKSHVRDVADIVKTQHIPGIVISRDSGNLCIGYVTGQVRMSFRRGCVPMVVFINNVRATNTNLAVQLPPESIDHIVIYKPIEAGNLFGLGSGNGVLAIFTRR